MMVTVSDGTADSDILLSDSDGNELLSWRPGKAYSSVIVSCPDIVQGASYTLTAGGSSTQVTMDSLVYGSGGTGGDPGSMGGSHGDMDGDPGDMDGGPGGAAGDPGDMGPGGGKDGMMKDGDRGKGPDNM